MPLLPALASGSTLEREETAAMALAELGRFSEAAARQRRAVALAEAAKLPGLAAVQARLALYEKGQPARAPWRE